MQENCRFFKYYFEPYISNEIIIENFKKFKNPNPIQFQKYNKAVERLGLGKNDEKYHSYRKKEVLEWCRKYDDSILRPVFNWSGQEVIDYIISNKQNPNPLYYLGAGRVGCWPCINTKHSEFKALMEFTPQIKNRLRNVELAVGSGFFAPNYIPKRYQTGVDPKSGKKYATTEDVINYLTEFTGDLFKDDESIDRSCMSNYGICE